jgi:hypothetical protein
LSTVALLFVGDFLYHRQYCLPQGGAPILGRCGDEVNDRWPIAPAQKVRAVTPLGRPLRALSTNAKQEQNALMDQNLAATATTYGRGTG